MSDFYSVDIASTDAPDIDFSDLESLRNEIEQLDNNVAQFYEGDNQITDTVNTEYQVSSLGRVPFTEAPMFQIRGGESMCPWIPGTRNREEVSLQVDKNIATNVPMNTPAVFKLTLGSIGPNGDDGLIYEIGIDEGGNPDGACGDIAELAPPVSNRRDACGSSSRLARRRRRLRARPRAQRQSGDHPEQLGGQPHVAR